MLVMIMYGFSSFIATIFGAAAAAVASSPHENNEASSELEENNEVWHDCIDNDPHTGVGFHLPESNSSVGDNSDDLWEIIDDILGHRDGDNSDDSWEIIDDRLGHSVEDAYGDSGEITDRPGHSGLESNLSIGDASSNSGGLIDRPSCCGVESNSSIGDTRGNSQAVLSTPCKSELESNFGEPGVSNQDDRNIAGAVEDSGRHESGLRYRGNAKGLAADQAVTACGTGSIENVKMGQNQNGAGQQNIGSSTYLRQFVAVQNIRIYDSNSLVSSLLAILLVVLLGVLVWSQCFIIALLELLLYKKQKLD